LDNTSLTLGNLREIAESFVNTLQNSYHQRIKYPEINNPEEIQKSNL
jgi:membrane-associated HD superfamily phosphohydrolase